MPFGIYSRSDYGYSGFLRPPLIRYDGYFGVSNSWLEEGAMVTAGVPQLFVEASVSRPHDVGYAIRRDGTDASVRVQGYKGQFVRRRELRAKQSVSVAALRGRAPGIHRRRRAMVAPGGVSGARRAPPGTLLRRGIDDRLVYRRHRPPARDGPVYRARPRRVSRL